MGGGTSLFERQSGNVGRIVRWCDADAGSNRASAAPGRNLSGGDQFELSRQLDISRRGVRTMVQPIVEFGAGAGHLEPQSDEEHECGQWYVDVAVVDVSALSGERVRWKIRGVARALLPGLAGASEL